MTYSEIFIQIISEVSGKPKQEITDLLSTFRKAHPGGKWDNIIPDNDAEKLLTELRAETPAFSNGLLKEP